MILTGTGSPRSGGPPGRRLGLRGTGRRRRAPPETLGVGGLSSMAGPADRLEVGVLESRPSGPDLDDVVHVEVARPAPGPAEAARVPVPVHHVGPGGLPEVVALELPSADPRAVRRPTAQERSPALDALSVPPGLGAAADPVREPRRR